MAPAGTPSSVTISYTAKELVPPPAVTRLSPNRGRTGGGTLVKVFGRHFVRPISVYFGKVRARVTTVVSATEIEVISPKGAGTVDVRVRTSGGTSTNTEADRFYY